MSSSLAIASVTAVLQYYLNSLYVAAGGQFSSTVKVSCLAPDQVQSSLGGASDPENQVNLFLHQVTHNPAWRNVDLAQLSADGKTRLKAPPLALDLHYLLTVYGSDYWQAEALLGDALMMLHETPVLTRSDIQNALTVLTTLPVPYPSNPLTKFIGATGLADQIEMIKITPETLGREEMAWLWTALKADYRPTFPFQVSVVLMQPTRETSVALPVLYRSLGAVPMEPPYISAVQPPSPKLMAEPGDPITVAGEFLRSATRLSFFNHRFGVQLFPAITGSTAFTAQSTLPSDTTGEYPAGIYDVTVQFLDTTHAIVQQNSNSISMPIAPVLPTQTATAALTTNPTGTLVKIDNFSPRVWEGQTVSLALSTQTAPYINVSAQAQSFTGKVSSLSFLFDGTLPTAQPMLGRLQIDGISSQVQVKVQPFPLPPTFDGPWVTLS